MTERLLPVQGGMATRRDKAAQAEVAATVCRRSGRVCPAALGFARQLRKAGELATAAAPEFEMTGATTLTGCAQGCPALFRITAAGVDVFCGVGPEGDAEALAQFATAFLGAQAARPLLAPPVQPLALLRVPGPDCGQAPVLM